MLVIEQFFTVCSLPVNASSFRIASKCSRNRSSYVLSSYFSISVSTWSEPYLTMYSSFAVPSSNDMPSTCASKYSTAQVFICSVFIVKSLPPVLVWLKYITLLTDSQHLFRKKEKDYSSSSSSSFSRSARRRLAVFSTISQTALSAKSVYPLFCLSMYS
ncbi:hypothetical protein BSP15_248 [Bacillus phage BSP15]|nr:hypothetical protein BSP15_248 [Bacillus phage BSP15]